MSSDSPRASVDLLVERLAVGTEGQCLAGTADRIAIVLGAPVIPRPRTGGQLPVLFRDLPWRLERFGVLNHHDRLEHRVVHLAQARRDTGRVTEDKAGAIDDDIVVA